jgi:hypothetical protein
VLIGTVTGFYLPTDAQYSCFKTILKFTLKQLLDVSVQSPSSGGVLFELAKVMVIKIMSCGWLGGVAECCIGCVLVCVCVWCVCGVCGVCVCVVCVVCV